MLVRKDLSTIWNSGGARAALTLLPVTLMVGLPIVYFALINLVPVGENAMIPQGLSAMLGSQSTGYRQFWMDAFSTLVCPMLFLTVPILSGLVTASCAFVSERENGTLESLFLSAMSTKSIFNAKVTACTLISAVISLLSFLLFTVTISVVDIFTGAPYFLSFEWVFTALLLAPALALFSVCFVCLMLTRMHSVREGAHTFGYLYLPVALLYLGQFSGLYTVNVLVLILLSAAVLAAAIVLYNLSAGRFHPETLEVRGNG